MVLRGRDLTFVSDEENLLPTRVGGDSHERLVDALLRHFSLVRYKSVPDFMTYVTLFELLVVSSGVLSGFLGLRLPLMCLMAW